VAKDREGRARNVRLRGALVTQPRAVRQVHM
jgi:hypothetical protein